MANTFLISDTHFGHDNIYTFKNDDGSKLRPFNCADEGDEFMIRQWNSVVKQHDKVYHLGDVCFHRKYLLILDRLNGNKTLIRGNHDIFKIKDYLKYFDNIYGVKVLSDMVLSHIPLHPSCITKRYNINVHGHLHGREMGDPKYFSVCVEKINYTPISIDQVRKICNNR